MSYETHRSGAQIDAQTRIGDLAGNDSGNPTTLLAFDRESMQGALAAIKAMESRDGSFSGVLPEQGPIGDLFSVEDWENIDTKTEFGISRTQTGNGETLNIDKIPGPDGKTYALAYTREGHEAKATFFEVDADGKKTEVTDPALLQDLGKRAALINAVDVSKDRLAGLNLSADQKSALDSIAAAVKAQDSGALTAAIDSFLKNGGTQQVLFMALPAELQVKSADALVAGGHSKDGVDTLSLLIYDDVNNKFKFEFTYTFPN